MLVVVFHSETEFTNLVVFANNTLVLGIVDYLPFAARTLKSSFMLLDLRFKQIKLFVCLIESFPQKETLLLFLFFLGGFRLGLAPLSLDIFEVLNGSVVPLGSAKRTH